MGWLIMLCYPNLAVHGLGRNTIVPDQKCTETCAIGVVLKWSQGPIYCLLNVNHVNILRKLITVISQGQSYETGQRSAGVLGSSIGVEKTWKVFW